MQGRPHGAPPVPPQGRRGAVVVDGVSRSGLPGAPRGDHRSVRRRWAAPAVVGAVAAAATGVLAVRSPHGPGSYGVCPFLAVTGLWCPACGGLRAVHELTQLDLAGAWAMNPLLVLGAPVLVALWALWLARGLGWEPVSGRTARTWPARPGPAPLWPAWALLGVAAAFTVVRNVPALAPWLAPV